MNQLRSQGTKVLRALKYQCHRTSEPGAPRSTRRPRFLGPGDIMVSRLFDLFDLLSPGGTDTILSSLPSKAFQIVIEINVGLFCQDTVATE